MAYKDEYEVARLFSDGFFRAQVDAEFEGVQRISFHLAPPLLSRLDPHTRRPRKMTLPGWSGAVFAVLAALKGLRGTSFDPFGWTAERKLERQARDLYIAAIEDQCGSLSAEVHAEYVRRAKEPLGVRGFGPVKRPALEALVASLVEGPTDGRSSVAPGSGDSSLEAAQSMLAS
jgi:indolepyruvate ferredoxin oxidoreductase